MLIGLAAVLDHGFELRAGDFPAGAEDARAAVAEEVGEIGHRHIGLDEHLFRAAQIVLARGVDVKHQDHRGRAAELELDIETYFDQHVVRLGKIVRALSA